MKKTETTEFEIDLKGLPDNLTLLIKEILSSADFSEIHNARVAIVSMGYPVLPYMHKLLLSENMLLRMEATKIVQLIANKRSVSKLVRMLDEAEFDIRWAAAEGLIRIGRPSILPILKSIRDGKSSFFHNKAAHHVLVNLLTEIEKSELILLLNSLDDYHELGEIAPTEASKAIKNCFKCIT